MSKNIKKRADLLNVLFCVSAVEMTKAEEEINVPLLFRCADEAGALDKRYASSAEDRETFAESVMRRAAGEPEKTSDTSPVKRTSKKVIAILIAAAILVITALAAVAISTDFFGLFVKDPRELLEWEDGESRRIGDDELIISSAYKEYVSVEELKNDFGDKYKFPKTPAEYGVTEIYCFSLENRCEITIKYEKNGVEIRYSVLPDREKPTSEELESSGYERVETRDGCPFYIMEAVEEYQGMARIGSDVYIVDSAGKNDIIEFIGSMEVQ